MFFVKTPLILLSAGTSATVTEFTIDQISGIILDKLQEDGAINMETNMLASVIIGLVGSKTLDVDQLKKLIEEVKRLGNKVKPQDLKKLIADIVEKWKAGAKNGVNEVSGLDDIYNVQKRIINQWKNNIATATNIQKGNFGEMASDAFLAEKNFQPLHTRLQNIDAPTRQGIDGVFKRGNEYFIVEAKYTGTATLSTLTDGTKQMSDAWITPRLLDAVGGNTSLRNQIANSYRKLLAEISPDGTVIYKELDGSANVIGIFTP